MKIIRVFPRKTKMTPTDENVRINKQPGLFDQADKVYISVTFTWDIPQAEKLYNSWKYVSSCEIGGPALNTIGENFTPGMFIKEGYTITSRGCNNNCWFCEVWKREGNVKELQINDGWNILDDNLLSCSNSHIDKVFQMLKRQDRKAVFSGGLEASLLTHKIAKQLYDLKPKTIYFAYDTQDDLEHRCDDHDGHRGVRDLQGPGKDIRQRPRETVHGP